MKKITLTTVLVSAWVLGGCQSDPPKLGLQGTQLLACPDTPNCVSSMAVESDKTHYIAPLTYSVPQTQAQDILAQHLKSLQDVSIQKSTPGYIYSTFTTPWMRFVDDVEFYISPQNAIHFRSASRVGRSDMGTNRKRIEALKAALKTELNP